MSAAPALSARLSPRSRVATAACVAAVLLLPLVETRTFVLHMLSLVAINAMVALGLQLLFGFSGQLSIGQAAFYGIGAYTSGLLTTKFGVPFPLAFLASALAASAASQIGRAHV